MSNEAELELAEAEVMRRLDAMSEQMEQKTDTHTPEPWTVSGLMGVAADGEPAFHCGLGIRIPSSVKAMEANTRRIVACVNACAGIETPVLEVTHGLNEIYDDIIAERNNLERQRNALDALCARRFDEIAELHSKCDALYEALKKAQRLITRTHTVVNINEIAEYLPHGFYNDVVDADVADSLGISAALALIESKGE